MQLLFPIVFATVLGLGTWYLGRRLISTSALDVLGRRLAWAVLIAIVLLPVGAMIGMRGGSERFGDALAWPGFLGLGFLSFLFTLAVLTDLFGLVRRLRSRGEEPADPSRRKLLSSVRSAGIVGGSSVLAGWGLAEALRVPEVLDVEVPIDNLPEGLDGFTIAQISDLHVGPTIKRDYVERVVERVNALSADVVALTGDFVDGTVAHLKDDTAPLAAIKARYGACFVTGNHEYYSGVSHWMDEFRRLGITVLHNEHRIIEHGGARLALAGVTDLQGGRFRDNHRSDPAAAIQGAEADLRVLLAHQPRSIYDAEKAGFDLQLSGHTHAGQFFPWNLLVYLAQPYVQGLHRHGRTWIYVNRGTGYWGPPARAGVPSEITRLVLRRA